MREITEIIIHCSATPEGRHVTVTDIDRWHRARGWRCIGYHYVIYLDGTIHPGRPIEQAGAHCTGHNMQSVAICYIGGVGPNGWPKDTRTPEQRIAMGSLLSQLLSKYPHAQVFGHNHFSPKACPCFRVPEEL